MVGFPRWIDYLPDEAAYIEAQKAKTTGRTWCSQRGGFLLRLCHYPHPHIPTGEMQENFVQIRGRVKDVKVGETYMGLQPMTTFIRTTVETISGISSCATPRSRWRRSRRSR